MLGWQCNNVGPHPGTLAERGGDPDSLDLHLSALPDLPRHAGGAHPGGAGGGAGSGSEHAMRNELIASNNASEINSNLLFIFSPFLYAVIIYRRCIIYNLSTAITSLFQIWLSDFCFNSFYKFRHV